VSSESPHEIPPSIDIFSLPRLAVGHVPLRASLAQKGDVAALSAKINELGRAGKYAEAVALAQGQAYGNQGRDGEAEPLFKRSIAILEKTTGLDSPDLR
jgi:Tetratricopeptide repeat